MKKLFLLALVFTILFGCSNLDELNPVTDEEYINKNSEGTFNEMSKIDLILDGNSVGHLSVALQRDSILIGYEINQDIIIKELKFSLSTTKENLPAAQGRLSPENFQFSENDLRMPLAKITGSAKYKGPIFFSFFCKVSFITSWSEDKIVEAKIRSTHGIGDSSYFKAFIADNSKTDEYLSYCLQGDQSMDTSFVHEVKRLSSLSKNQELLESTIDAPENLDLVNWVLNQDPSRWTRTDGNPANGADRQMAIWKLIEKTGNPTGVNIAGKFDIATVNKIVKDAQSEGNNYKPFCGDKVLYVLHKGPIGGKNSRGTYNTGTYANPDYQVAGVVKTFDCYGLEVAVWALGKKYFSEDEGTYFVMLKN